MRRKKEFDVKELIRDLRVDQLSYEDNFLVSLLEKLKKLNLVDEARDFYYSKKSRSYGNWYADEDAYREFWEKVEYDFESLSPDESGALDCAKRGLAGKEIFASTMVWLEKHNYIRMDITIQNCKLYRYIDSYINIAPKNIMNGIFEKYEDIRDIKEINAEVDKLMAENFTAVELKTLYRQIEHDVKCFEIDVRPVVLRGLKDVLDRMHNTLRSISGQILEIVFKEGCK